MKRMEKLGILIKYIPLLLLVWMVILALYISVTTISEEVERNIQIWTNGLRLAAAAGVTESFIFQDVRGKLELGEKAPNLVKDFMEKDGEKIAVLFNDVCVVMILGTLAMLMSIIYMHTKIRLFFICGIVLSMICLLGVIINMLALYLQKINSENQHRNLSKISNSGLLTMIIELFLFLVTSRSAVGIAYMHFYEKEDTIQTILIIIVILCYVLALAFCHFSNLYCLTAVGFMKTDGKVMQEKVDDVRNRNKKREDDLRQTTKYVDEKGGQVGLFEQCKLGLYYLYCQIKSYCQARKYEMEYLTLFIRHKIVRLLSRLSEEDRFKTNSVRFCEIMSILELLILDMLLFAYWGSEAICSRFFELLSTVVVIPIFLSSLAKLKSLKH